MSGLFLWRPHSLDTALESTSLKMPFSLLVHLIYLGQVSLFWRSWSKNSHRYVVLPENRQTCNQMENMWCTQCNKIQMYWSDVTSCPVTVSVNYAHYCFLCTHNYSHMARPSVQSLLYKRLTVLHMKQKHSFMKKASSRFSSFCLINKKTKQKCYPVTFP